LVCGKSLQTAYLNRLGQLRRTALSFTQKTLGTDSRANSGQDIVFFDYLDGAGEIA
jgi:hypothetical protein